MKKLFTVLFLCSFVNLPIFAQPAQVMIIRHAESDDCGTLNERGLERAGALGPYFALTSFLLDYGPPTAIFAARPNPDAPSNSCLQTLGPTGHILKLPIHTGYAEYQYRKLAKHILNQPQHEGKNILICWEGKSINKLATALGIAYTPYFPEAYDQVWVITYTPDPVLSIYQQQLLYGDQ
jgi:hypothetical protein